MYEDFSKKQKWRRIWTVWRGTQYLWNYLQFRTDGRAYQGFTLLELSGISLLPSKAQRIHSAIKMQNQTPRTAQLERYNIERRNPRCPRHAGWAEESPAASTALVSSVPVPVESHSSRPMLIPDQQSPDQSCSPECLYYCGQFNPLFIIQICWVLAKCEASLRPPNHPWVTAAQRQHLPKETPLAWRPKPRFLSTELHSLSSGIRRGFPPPPRHWVITSCSFPELPPDYTVRTKLNYKWYTFRQKTFYELYFL